MRRLHIVSLFLLSIVACENTGSQKKFTVSGTIENNTANMIYLEKVSAAVMQPLLVDSAIIGKEGKFTLKADASEAVIYNIRLGRNEYPIASVINDTDKVKLDVRLSKENNQFADKYEVEGSPASQRMKDFMITFNNDLQQIFIVAKREDSLRRAGTPDSLLIPLRIERSTLAEKVKNFTISSMAIANNPALVMFELGYYQSTSGSQGFGLDPFSDEKVVEVVNNTVEKFPSHQAVAAVKAQLDDQARKQAAATWVGKEAPDFALPDPTGKEIKLSSFRGKYVLVDFWASWCGPCRAENPNVVKVHSQYKNKNFTVLGVSLDRPGEKDKWMKAIKDDQLLWTQVSDLQYWNSSVVPVYHIEGIPFNVLVDPQGMIIAEGLRGVALERKLQEVLQ